MNMMNKNKIYKLTQTNTGEVKYFSSGNKCGNYVGDSNVIIDYYAKRKKPFKRGNVEYFVEVIDGSELKLKEIDTF